MSNQEKFDQAYKSFVPAADDNPDNVPFYRAYAGLKLAWGERFAKAFGHVVHHCACCISSKNDLERHPNDLYQFALKQLNFYLTNNWTVPEDPRYQGFYDQKPIYPGEVQVREFFNQQFKGKFPGERINSKHAKALWIEFQDIAKDLVVKEYQKKLEHYQHREKTIEDGNRARRDEWMDKIQERALFEEEVRKILDAEAVHA
jgi:hypothetical protein